MLSIIGIERTRKHEAGASVQFSALPQLHARLGHVHTHVVLLGLGLGFGYGFGFGFGLGLG